MARPDLYISVDVEADGPIPGDYSMLSFGMCVAARFDGETFQPTDPDMDAFYRELRPISERWLPEAVEVSGLDRDRLAGDGTEPVAAMTEAAQWVQGVAGDARPVAVAFPLAFDWLFLYWYLARFAESGSPFEFSSALDMKTMFARGAGVVLDQAGLGDIPLKMRSSRPHTHHALDDAKQQAELFAGLWALSS